MKVAIVLGGGGSKGAYQIGAWRALRELGIKYDVVTGTSIGALNGALMVLGDYEKALGLWREIDIDKVVLNGLNLRTDLQYYYENSEKLLPFIKSYKDNKGMDITPLKKIIQKCVDERFFSSSVDYALMSVRFPSFVPVKKYKNELSMENFASWILASASCFPAFPVCEIDGEGYIDGGYYDNLPISLAFELGAEQVIAIALNPESHPFSHHPLVKNIYPLQSLGGMLDFDKMSIEENLELGYFDTLKAFGKLQGFTYSFYPNTKDMPQYLVAMSRALSVVTQKELHNTKELPFALHKALEFIMPLESKRILELLSHNEMMSVNLGEIHNEKSQMIFNQSKLAAMVLCLVELMMGQYDYERKRIYHLNEVLDELKAKNTQRQEKAEFFQALNLSNVYQSDEKIIGAFFHLFCFELQGGGV